MLGRSLKLSFLMVSVIVTTAFGQAASENSQTVSGGSVTAKVTYLNPRATDSPRFRVILDTHSVSLDSYDLKAITILRDDSGKEYLPTAAENKGGGHHREVTLVFPKLVPEAKRLELVIRDVAGVKERLFGWNLE